MKNARHTNAVQKKARNNDIVIMTSLHVGGYSGVLMSLRSSEDGNFASSGTM
jgi:hypothetical protein